MNSSRLVLLLLLSVTLTACQNSKPAPQPSAIPPENKPAVQAPAPGVTQVQPTPISEPAQLKVKSPQDRLVDGLKEYKGTLHDSQWTKAPTWDALKDSKAYTVETKALSKAFSWVTFSPEERSDESPPLYALYTSDRSKVVWAQTALIEPKHSSSHEAFVFLGKTLVMTDSDQSGGSNAWYNTWKLHVIEQGVPKQVLKRSFDLNGCRDQSLKECKDLSLDLVLPHSVILDGKDHYVTEARTKGALSYTFTTYPIDKRVNATTFKVRKVVESCVWKVKAPGFVCKKSSRKVTLKTRP